MGGCLTGTALNSSSWPFGETNIIESSRQRHLNIKLLLSERTCGNKRRKMSFYNLRRRWNLSINVRFSFHVSIFCTFFVLAGPHFPMSHFLIIVNDSVSCRFQCIRNLQNISSHCGTMTRVNEMQCFKESFSAIIIVTIPMMMIMIV